LSILKHSISLPKLSNPRLSDFSRLSSRALDTYTNKTHESTTDADARLYKKSYGKESKLSYLGHALVENRNGLIAAAMASMPMDTPNAMPRC
jgi:hypothetical protein